MRRLAKQSRKDTYKSNRDYQTLHDRQGRQFTPRRAGSNRLVFRTELPRKLDLGVCWGGYIRIKPATTFVARLTAGTDTHEESFKVDQRWSRVGGLMAVTGTPRTATLVLEWEGEAALAVWGLGIGTPQVPQGNGDAKHDDDSDPLTQAHLIPETYYLPHVSPIDVDFVADESTRITVDDGVPIKLKKCSYCGRLLPVDPRRLGVLAFHKHNAKKTNHQNECRSCKKWRINDSFNPLRTTDQLHESSVITRERKLFLREPEILQAIKDRTGAGLKSQIWERFDRKCFRCGTPVALDDFQLDHTRPLAYLWPIDEHATCLCSNCNNEKKEKFPVDFYTPTQLKRLSDLTGLPLPELSKKELNGRELKRILDDLPKFAREWEPRTFAATARKIKELRPDLDLLEELKKVSRSEFKRLDQELKDRPPPVDDEV